MNDIKLFHKKFYAMNTRFEAVFYNQERERAKNVFDKIGNAVLNVEILLSPYYENGEIYKINHNHHTDIFEISAELSQIIARCNIYKKKTLGYFEYLFDKEIVYNDKSFDMPEKINNKNKHHEKEEKIVIDSENHKITFPEQKYYFDFGAVGKGFALEAVNNILKKNNISNCFISFGESSILTRGSHPYGNYWPFSLLDMQDKKKQLVSLKLNDHAISTSATLQNMENQSKRYHIINPTTGKYVESEKMVCVKSESAIEAEILSTALIVADKDVHSAMLEQFDNYEIITVNYDKNQSNIRRIYA